MSPTAKGSCACGVVEYEINSELRSVANCHCEPCWRITGHFMATTAVDTQALRLVADELRWYDSTPTVQYGFCASTVGQTIETVPRDRQLGTDDG